MTARGSVRHAVRLDVGADDVWALLGDAARVTEWFPGIVGCTIDGDHREITTASGLPMPEVILTDDARARRFQYRITSPLVHEHLSTIDVIDLGDGTCLASYAVDADPAPLALVIGGAARAGLEALRERFGDPTPTPRQH